MLFKLDKDTDFFELNPSAKAIPLFADRTSQQMIFISLVADYKSPLRLLPEKARREKAAVLAGYKFEKEGGRLDKNGRQIVGGQVETVEAAIREYRTLAPDDDAEMLQAINNQIAEAMELMSMDKKALFKEDPKLAMSITKESIIIGTKLADLKETKVKLQDTIKSKELDLGIVTYTSNDLSEDDSEQSTLQRFMDKQI